MSAAPGLASVFISYSSKDQAKVIALARALEKEGISIWRDHDQILGGENYGPKIVEAIRSAKVMLVCCSNAAMRSKNVKQEIQLAWRYDVPYFPILLEQVTYPEQVEYWLLGWQHVDLSNCALNSAIPAIVAGVRALADGTSIVGAQAVGPLREQSNGLDGLFAAARLTDQIWPMVAPSQSRTRSRLRDLGAPQDNVQHGFPLGSQVHIAIETEAETNLLLLNKGTSGKIYCLCPSLFAPNQKIHRGLNTMPQQGSPYPSFAVTGLPGHEHLLGILADEPIGADWMPAAGGRTPARILDRTDISSLLQRVRDMPGDRWTALATYFEILPP